MRCAACGIVMTHTHEDERACIDALRVMLDTLREAVESHVLICTGTGDDYDSSDLALSVGELDEVMQSIAKCL